MIKIILSIKSIFYVFTNCYKRKKMAEFHGFISKGVDSQRSQFYYMILVAWFF